MDNNNAYVGDGNIHLYTYENDMVIKVHEIMQEHTQEFNNKDYIKKSIELFHLLTYLDINEDFENVLNIVPNEPGDFLVTVKDKNILFEVVTVFGDKEAKLITDLIKELLTVEDESYVHSFRYPEMNTSKLNTQLKRILYKKKNKSYFFDFDYVILLLVTSEHDRCGVSSWHLVEDIEEDINDFISTTQSSIKTMNYFGSRKNMNPITNDIECEIDLYNKYLKFK